MWRPDKKKWEKTREDLLNRYAYLKTIKEKIYFLDGVEAGADAMLEALKGEGSYYKYEKPTLIKGLTEQSKGWLIFIPDEATNEKTTLP